MTVNNLEKEEKKEPEEEETKDLKEEEKSEKEAKSEEEVEQETEEEEEEEDENELSSTEVRGVPMILCPEDFTLMETDGTEIREIEESKFLFGSETKEHLHLKYECPECGRYYFHDLEMKKQGCFIATAAYGTPLAEEINVLRKVRDSYLVHREWGKELVSLYYTLSPPIAEVIEKSEPLKKLVRTFLKPLVEFFKEKYD